jgi:hypothetical protein
MAAGPGRSRARAALRAALATCLLAGVLAGAPARAEDAPAVPPKFRLEGPVLVYDTETAPEGVSDDMAEDDVAALIALLRANPQVTTLALNSGGGSVWAGDRMAEVVIDFELDTHVNGECISACVTVFLGGARRTMSRGSRIGFHQISWAPDSIRRFYESEREGERWDTPFDFAAWLYADTQTEAYQRLSYMVSRGVDPMFAIETLRTPTSETWVPWRARLRAAGVLTE